MGKSVIQGYRPASIPEGIDVGTAERHDAPGRLGEPALVVRGSRAAGPGAARARARPTTAQGRWSV